MTDDLLYLDVDDVVRVHAHIFGFLIEFYLDRATQLVFTSMSLVMAWRASAAARSPAG